MQKVENWTSKLDTYLTSTMDLPFKVGHHCCCIAVAHCLKEITGENVVRGIFKGVKNQKKADKILDEYGDVYGVAEHIATLYDIKEIPISYATGGDVVVLSIPEDRIALGIIGLNGRHIYTAARPCGWATFPLSHAKKAYRI